MADLYGKLLTKLRANRRGNPREGYGKVRVIRLDMDSQDAAQNDIIGLAILPAGWTLIYGLLIHPAWGTGVTVDLGTFAIDEDGRGIGTVDDVDRFMDGDDQAAAGTIEFAVTAATGFGYTPTVNQIIGATLLSANPDAGAFDGYIMVVGD